MEHLIVTVKNWLETKHIYVTDKWMRECTQFFKDQNPGLTIDELKVNAFQQWLLADLDKINCPVFPSCYDNCDEYTLEGTYSVQMNYFYNSSKPYYSQLLKLEEKDNNIENLDVDPYDNIILVLSDGVRILRAVELYTKIFRPIYPPGTKILLEGPIKCKLGILFLTPENFSILGGEAMEKIVIYTPKNILRMKLGLPIENESEDQTNNGIDTENTATNQILAPNQNTLRNTSENKSLGHKSNASSIKNELIESFENDDFEENIDIDELEKMEKEFSQSASY